jgi:hypothetical protein
MSKFRAVAVNSFPADQVAESLVLSQLPPVVLFAAAIVFTRLRMRRA